MDDGDCGHRLHGLWHGTPGQTDGYRGDQFYANKYPAGEESLSVWKFSKSENGKYEVYVTWSASDSGVTGIATNAPYTVRNLAGPQGVVRVNQSIDPQAQGGVLFDGEYWFKLGEYRVEDNVLQVNLTNRANGAVLADAVRIVKKPGSGGGSGTLVLTGKALASVDNVVENQKNVNFLRFEAKASQATDDIFLTYLEFEAATNGSLVNGHNHTLWVDTDGDGVVDTILETGLLPRTAPSSSIT